MTSTISDHFVLETYTSSSRGKGSKKQSHGVLATSCKKANSADGYVTVAAQADGLHIIDVATLHPIISHTLGPSTSFSCPPLTLSSTSKHTSSTYAVIATSPDLTSQEDSGRALWMWQDDESNTKQKDKETNIVLSKGQHAYGIYSCPALRSRIVVASTGGELSSLDAESLEVKSSIPPKHLNVLYGSMLPADTTPFAATKTGATLILCQSDGSKTYLRVFSIDDADAISEQLECEVPVDSQKIISVSCSRTGVLSILCADGLLSSHLITTEKLVPLSAPLPLAGFTFISSSNKSPVSLLALTSSHVLLAAVASREIALLLWDVQFSVLLASHTLPIPSALAASTLQLHLVPGVENESKDHTRAMGQAILILSSDTSDNKTISVLLAVPYSVPTKSTIAAAMGRGAAGKKWLRAADEAGASGKLQQTEAEIARAKMLSTVRTAMQAGRPQGAVAAFQKWVPAADESVESSFDYNFVKELLSVVLQVPVDNAKMKANADVSYTPEIVQHLLEKRVVSSAMVTTPGGLLGALRSKDDWKSIELAFSKVLDLSESEIVETLRAVIAYHRTSKNDDSMDVDHSPAATTSSILSLPTMLNLVATYPTSRGPLLVAFRRSIPDAIELTIILELLNDWIAQLTNLEKQLMPSKKDLKKTEHGVWVVAGRKHETKGNKAGVPPLEKIVELIQVILDTSFLVLLQHTPAHKVLQNINSQLSPEIMFAGAIEALRGPLEPFAIAQEKAVKESMIPAQEREREKQKGDWRQRRKGVGVADIGLYQLEELVL